MRARTAEGGNKPQPIRAIAPAAKLIDTAASEASRRSAPPATRYHTPPRYAAMQMMTNARLIFMAAEHSTRLPPATHAP
jgi:hypothetical protein